MDILSVLFVIMFVSILIGIAIGMWIADRRLRNALYPKMTHTLPVTADISTAHDERIETPDARRNKIKFVGSDRRKRSKL